jgi:hypothetical protein
LADVDEFARRRRIRHRCLSSVLVRVGGYGRCRSGFLCRCADRLVTPDKIQVKSAVAPAATKATIENVKLRVLATTIIVGRILRPSPPIEGDGSKRSGPSAHPSALIIRRAHLPRPPEAAKPGRLPKDYVPAACCRAAAT